MANREHLEILKQGVEAWNRWRAEKAGLVPDLSGADLYVGVLNHANLSNTILEGADLNHGEAMYASFRSAMLQNARLDSATLTEADFRAANLDGCSLKSANLANADLRTANLTGANFQRARLLRTDFSCAFLENSDFEGAMIGWADFGGTDLSTVKGLETLLHTMPSSIGIDTLVKSRGRIPAAFLRGAGLPDTFIEFAKSLVSEPIQFYSCFISYSTMDQAFADRIYADLQTNGVRCWFAPEDVKGGKKLHEQIDEAIRIHDRLLLILSEHSMNSEWVKTEIASARAREVSEQRQMLFPISLVPFENIKEWKAFDADTGKDSAREIREYFIPDFNNWKDRDSYQKAFEGLLRGLKADLTEATDA
jgi:hypothetical protein